MIILILFNIKGLSPSKKVCFILLKESPLKMMKNCFYFVLKALFVIKAYKSFVLTFWVMWNNGLIRKLRGNFISYHPGLYTNPLRNLFSLEPWLDLLKLKRNPKLQVLGSSGTLLFWPFRIRLLN